MQGIEKALGDKRIRAVFGGESESGLEYFRWNLRLFPLFLAIFLIMCGSAWGACGKIIFGPQTVISNPYSTGYCKSGTSVSCKNACTGGILNVNCTGSTEKVPTSCVTTTMNCSFNPFMVGLTIYGCDTQEEADSLNCVNDGGIWATNSQGQKYCAKSYCTAEDSLNLQREIAHCDSLGATNDFALANNEECSLTGICNLCSGNAYRNYVQNLKERCCELGKIPDSVKCVMKDITSTQNNYAELQGDGCLSTGGSVNITPNGETIVEGCENFNSSNSQNQSSDSQNQSSSSECIGFDCPSSDSKNLDDISGQLEDIKDSLHRIIIYDSTTAHN